MRWAYNYVSYTLKFKLACYQFALEHKHTHARSACSMFYKVTFLRRALIPLTYGSKCPFKSRFFLKVTA